MTQSSKLPTSNGVTEGQTHKCHLRKETKNKGKKGHSGLAQFLNAPPRKL